MDDLISRQAAIDALDGEIEITGRTNAEAVKGYVRLVKDRLKRLPSAQPSSSCVHENDTISRQAAIDAHCEICGDRGRCNSDICPDMEAFQLLPSAQPDISEYSDKLWRNAYERGKRDAQPEQRWIPVSEMEPQLPCIASDAHGNPPFIPNGILCLTTEKHDEYYIDAQYLKDGVGLLFENRIVAWMPLPKPYKAERQEE